MEQKLFTGNGWIEFYDITHGTRIHGNEDLEDLNDYLTIANGEILIFTNVTLIRELSFINVYHENTFLLQLHLGSIRIIFADSKESKTPNEILVVDGAYEKTANSTLCGNKFRGENLVIANPDDLAFGEVLEKKCENCFFKPTQDLKRCNILPGKGNWRPRTLFRRRKNEEMLSIIDQKQVAQYCNYFTHWNAE